MVFGQNFCENDKFGYLSPILGKLGVTHDLDWWLVEKRIVDILFALVNILFSLIELFALSSSFICSKWLLTTVDYRIMQ